MSDRIVPYDIDFTVLNRSRKIEKAFLIISFLLSFTLNLISAFKFNLNPYVFDIILIIGIIALLTFTALIIVNDYVLFPSCENKRRSIYLDSAFNSHLSDKNIDPNFYNPELCPGIYKLAVNGFENCFFTYNVAKKMLFGKILKDTVIILMFIIIAYVGIRNTFSTGIIFLQLLVSGLFLNDLIRFLIYHQRNYQYFNNYKLLFNRIGYSLNADDIPEIIKNILDYECNLNWGTISLNSKMYEQLKDYLNQEWEEIKRNYGISNANSITIN